MNLQLLTSRSRVMMFAPHPDDESLAAGIFLQRAVAAGAAVRVIYATNGERNCWPQRFFERKLRLRESDRRRWGARRQREARAALRVLGIGPDQVAFLSLPDQGVTDLLLQGCGETLGRLSDPIRLWRPTHLLLPSAADTHPDHSALAVLLDVAMDDYRAPEHSCTRLHYLVHGASESFIRQARELPHSRHEERAKRRAIVCHVTQVALSRRRFLSYARRTERFVIGEERMSPSGGGAIRSFQRDRHDLRLRVAFTIKPLRTEETSFYLLGHDPMGGWRCLRATLPGHRARVDLIDLATGDIAAVGRYEGDAFRAEIVLPMNGFALDRNVFVKLDRRVWFFDEAGWLEIASAVARPARPRPLAIPARELAVA